MQPEARADGATVAELFVPRMNSTIAFAFARGIGLVLLFETVQPEGVLSFTFPVPPRLRAAGGAR